MTRISKPQPHPALALCRAVALSLVAGLSGLPAQAGQANAELLVRVKLAAASAPAPRVFCSSGAGTGTLGATVTVVCSTGAVVDLLPAKGGQYVPTHGGAQRYLVQVGQGTPALGWMDAQTTAGTVTGWQMVRRSGQDYVELTLGW